MSMEYFEKYIHCFQRNWTVGLLIFSTDGLKIIANFRNQ